MGPDEPVSSAEIPVELSCSDLVELSAPGMFRTCLWVILADSSTHLEQICREMKQRQ